MSAVATSVHAVRYARAQRRRSESFIGGDPHDGPMPMAYYVWLIQAASGPVVVDTGCEAAVARARGREHLICPGAALRLLGVDPAAVDDVVLTHLHYDHAGNHGLFARARFHVQARELAYVTGPWMTHRQLRQGYAAEDVKAMVDRLFADRLVFHDGDGQVVPGVTVHRIGGHTRGLQAVRVATAAGPLVLASDAAVLYENLTTARPFPAAFHVGRELLGYRLLLELADGDPARIVPGHDTAVMERYPAALDGVAWRLDGGLG